MTNSINKLITQFLRRRKKFTGPELSSFVISKNPTVKEDSVTRVLRTMRTEGLVNYQVLNKNESLYKVLQVR